MMGDARRERERESRICLFEESEPRRTVAKGCIIKSIHSGLPNRSILIREPFQGRRYEKRTRLFVHLLARDGASFFPLPPLVDTEKMARQLSCGFRLALWRRGKGHGRAEYYGERRMKSSTEPCPFDRIDPKF